LFYELSREFSWDPDQIRRLTFQELEIYAAENHRLRRNVPMMDRSLHAIRRALFAFFGIKERKPIENERELDGKLKQLGAITITESEMKAWLDAGMPSPPQAFLRTYRARMRQQNGG